MDHGTEEQTSEPTNEPTDQPAEQPADFWENRYASSDRVWSGRANATLVDVVAGMTPGRSLDLGCGEGGDVIWLAQHGWQAAGIDISPTAIAHAREAATALGLGADRASFESADLDRLGASDTLGASGGIPHLDAAPFDLVTACFLQSPVALAREQVLRRALELIAPAGRLLIVAHAAPPPWSGLGQRHPDGMPQPADDLAALSLDPALWDVELAEVRQRAATGPDGEHAVLDDGVLLVRRR